MGVGAWRMAALAVALLGVVKTGLGGEPAFDPQAVHIRWKKEGRQWIARDGTLAGEPVVMVTFAKEVKEEGLEKLRELVHLRGVSLRMTDATDEHVAKLTEDQLKGLNQLRWLDLARTRITDASLGRVKELAMLETLFLSETPVTDAGVAKLSSLDLQTLELDHTQVTDDVMATLKRFKHLRTLSLAWMPVTDAVLDDLKTMDTLRSLDLAGTKITLAGMERLKVLRRLQKLRVPEGGSDAVVKFLANFPELQSLELSYTYGKLTDEGLGDPGRVPRLAQPDVGREQDQR